MEIIMFRTSFIAIALIASGSSAAHANACAETPEFAAHRTSNSSVRAQFNALSRGEIRQAIHFGEEAVNSGTSVRHRAAALSNLCAAYALDGQAERALTACNAAVEARPDSWRAHNNFGAAQWLFGNYDAADAHFSHASELSAGESEIVINASLSQCAAVG
jgi:Flp pilus assembly protein TadD